MKKLILHIAVILLLFSGGAVFAKQGPADKHHVEATKLTIEPGIGTSPMSLGDISLNNLIQWNIKKRVSLLAHTAIAFHDPFSPAFNYITTNYNFSVMQKVGIGTSAYGKRSAHTFALLAGLKYDAYSETMSNPEFEELTVTRNTISPDFGFMYAGKVGRKKCFFSYRVYVPLYPYPVKGLDALSLDGNMANISLEAGLGIRIK